MARVYIDIHMAPYTKESGSRTSSTEKESRVGLMAQNTKVIIETEKKMEKAHSTLLTEASLRVSSFQMRSQDMAATYGRMVNRT